MANLQRGMRSQLAIAQEDARSRAAVYSRRTRFGRIEFWLFIVNYVEGIAFAIISIRIIQGLCSTCHAHLEFTCKDSDASFDSRAIKIASREQYE